MRSCLICPDVQTLNLESCVTANQCAEGLPDPSVMLFTVTQRWRAEMGRRWLDWGESARPIISCRRHLRASVTLVPFAVSHCCHCHYPWLAVSTMILCGCSAVKKKVLKAGLHFTKLKIIANIQLKNQSRVSQVEVKSQVCTEALQRNGERWWGMMRVRNPALLSRLRNEDIDHRAHSADSSSCLWSGDQSEPPPPPSHTRHKHCIALTMRRSEVSPELLIQHQVRNVHQAFSWLSNLFQGNQMVLSNVFTKVCTKLISLINYSPMVTIFY